MATFSDKAAEWRHRNSDRRVTVQQSSPANRGQFGPIGTSDQEPPFTFKPPSPQPGSPAARDGNSSGHGTLGPGSNTRESNLSAHSWRAAYSDGPSPSGRQPFYHYPYHHRKGPGNASFPVARNAYSVASDGPPLRYPARPAYNLWSHDYFSSTRHLEPHVTSLFDEDDECISTTAAMNAIDAMPFKPHEENFHSTKPDVSSTKACGGSPKQAEAAAPPAQARADPKPTYSRSPIPGGGDRKHAGLDENESQWPSSISTDRFSQDPNNGTEPSTSRAHTKIEPSRVTNIPPMAQVSNEEPSPGSSGATPAPTRTLITKYTLGGQHNYCAQNNEQFPVENAAMMRSNNNFHHIPAVCSTTVYPNHSMSSPESQHSFPVQPNVSILSSVNVSEVNNVNDKVKGMSIQTRPQPTVQVKVVDNAREVAPTAHAVHVGSVEKPGLTTLEPCYSIEVLCRDYLRGSCKRKRCRFSHPSQEELTNSVSALVQCDDNTRKVLQLSSSKKHPNQNGDPNHVWCGDEKVQAHYRQTGQVPLCYLRNWLKACSLSLQKERDCQKLTTICDAVGQNIHMVERDLINSDLPARHVEPPVPDGTMAAGATAATENALRRQQRTGKAPAVAHGFHTVPAPVQHPAPVSSVPIEDFRKLYYAYETSVQRINVLEQKYTEMDRQLQQMKLAFSHSIGLNSALQNLNNPVRIEQKQVVDFNVNQSQGLLPKYNTKHRPRDKQAQDHQQLGRHDPRGKRSNKVSKERREDNMTTRRPAPTASRSTTSQTQSTHACHVVPQQCHNPTIETKQIPLLRQESQQGQQMLSAPVPSAGTASATLRTGQLKGATLLVNLEEINIIKSTKAMTQAQTNAADHAAASISSPVKPIPASIAHTVHVPVSHHHQVQQAQQAQQQAMAHAQSQAVVHHAGPPMLSTPAIQTAPVEMCRPIAPRMQRIDANLQGTGMAGPPMLGGGYAETHTPFASQVGGVPVVPVMSGSTVVSRPPPSIFTPVHTVALGHAALTASAMSVVAGPQHAVNLAQQQGTIPVHPISTAPIHSSVVLPNVLPPPPGVQPVNSDPNHFVSSTNAGVPATVVERLAPMPPGNVAMMSAPQDMVAPGVPHVPVGHAGMIGSVQIQGPPTGMQHPAIWPT